MNEMQRVFILGNPRSGTSLLRLMLNSHPCMAAPPESGFLHWWYTKYGTWTLQDSQSPDRVKEFVNDLLTSKKIETWHIDASQITAFIMEQEPADYRELGSLVYLFWARKNKNKVDAIIDKNNYYIHHLEELMAIWPDCKFIFLIRDGRDVACSYKDLQKLDSTSPYKPNLPVRIEDIALEWQGNNQHIYDFLQKLPEERWIMIRYEDLLTNTRATLTKIISILDVEFSEQMLSYYAMNDEPASTLDWKRKTLEKPDVGNINRYKSMLAPEEIKEFNKLASNMLTTAGYAI